MRAENKSSVIQRKGMEPFTGNGSLEFHREIQRRAELQRQQTTQNLNWLFANMHPYFFITMKHEAQTIINLASRLHDIGKERKITLTDQEKKLILARIDMPGSIYDTLKRVTFVNGCNFRNA